MESDGEPCTAKVNKSCTPFPTLAPIKGRPGLARPPLPRARWAYKSDALPARGRSAGLATGVKGG